MLQGLEYYETRFTFADRVGPGIDSKESIPLAYVLCSPAGRYDNPIPTWII
jgi:hypothetical protein